MKRKWILWMMALALAAAPALVSAQNGPGPDDEDEAGMDMPQQPGGPGMGPGQGMGMGPGQGMGPGGMDRQMMKGRMMRGGMGGPGFISEEEVLKTINKHDPAFGKKMEQLREAAPGKYKMVIQMSGKLFAAARMEKDESLEKDAVRALSLEFESKELSMSYGKASDSEKKEIKAKLSKALSELFDLKSKGQELRVKRMEEDLGNLKKRLEKRKANKDKIVQQRLDQLTGEGYGW
ncbi:MAG: hypothetical protein M0011_12940 [Elusimicrobia bacterium]|nr:hypothetical protein [Elusimicrobiota bacterium]